MNNLLYCIILTTATIQVHPAAGPFALTNAQPFELSCNDADTITILPPESNLDWFNVYNAIHRNDIATFKRFPLAHLVNKAFFVHDPAERITVRTLLENTLYYPYTDSRTEMIKDLLRAGAHTRSSYCIKIGDAYEDHFPPIYYAIIKAHVAAFKILWYTQNDVPMGGAVALWSAQLENRSKTYGTSIIDFLTLVKDITTDIPTLYALDDMIEITQRSMSSSCELQ